MVTLILRPLLGPEASLQLFAVDLLDGSYALLSMVDHRICSVTIHHAGQLPYDRGLFGTTNDAMEVLRAEVSARGVKTADHSCATRSSAVQSGVARASLTLAEKPAAVHSPDRRR
jgi:hypothetical protein